VGVEFFFETEHTTAKYKNHVRSAKSCESQVLSLQLWRRRQKRKCTAAYYNIIDGYIQMECSVVCCKLFCMIVYACCSNDYVPCAPLLYYVLQLGETCPGTCIDYMYDNVKAPYCFAFEIYDGVQYRGNPRDTKDTSSQLFQYRGDPQDTSTLFGDTTSSIFGNPSPDTSELLQLNSHSRAHRTHRMRSHSHSHNSYAHAHTNHTRMSCFVQTAEMMEKEYIEKELSGDIERKGYHPENKIFPIPTDGDVTACLKDFNPVSKPLYESTLANWSEALEFVIYHTAAPQNMYL